MGYFVEFVPKVLGYFQGIIKRKTWSLSSESS